MVELDEEEFMDSSGLLDARQPTNTDWNRGRPTSGSGGASGQQAGRPSSNQPTLNRQTGFAIICLIVLFSVFALFSLAYRFVFTSPTEPIPPMQLLILKQTFKKTVCSIDRCPYAAGTLEDGDDAFVIQEFRNQTVGLPATDCSGLTGGGVAGNLTASDLQQLNTELPLLQRHWPALQFNRDSTWQAAWWKYGRCMQYSPVEYFRLALQLKLKVNLYNQQLRNQLKDRMIPVGDLKIIWNKLFDCQMNGTAAAIPQQQLINSVYMCSDRNAAGGNELSCPETVLSQASPCSASNPVQFP